MQLGDLQIKFNESPAAEQLEVVLNVLIGANKPAWLQELTLNSTVHLVTGTGTYEKALKVLLA